MKKPHLIPFAEKLKSAREAKDLGQTALAKLLGTDQQRVYEWENASTEPKLETIKKIAAALNVSADWLLGLSPTPDGLNEDEIKLLEIYRAKDSEGQQRLLEVAKVV